MVADPVLNMDLSSPRLNWKKTTRRENAGWYRLQIQLQTDRQDWQEVSGLYPTPSKGEQDYSSAGVETWSKGPVETLNCLVTLLLS